MMLSIPLCGLSGCAETAPVSGEPMLYADFYKIGAADAILLRGTGETPFSVLIDTGEADDAQEILSGLRSVGVSRLDCMIFTHFDKDHIGSAPAILSKISADRILMPTGEGTGEAYDALSAVLASIDTPAERLSEDCSFSFGETVFSVSVPKSSSYEKAHDNNSSLAILVTFGENRLYFTGDAERLRQEELLAEGLSHVTLLKVPHHGVWNKKLDEFFAPLSPDYAVITCSSKNPAEQKTLDALNALGTETYLTADGNISFVCTRQTISAVRNAG